jgi:hypothetical protein
MPLLIFFLVDFKRVTPRALRQRKPLEGAISAPFRERSGKKCPCLLLVQCGAQATLRGGMGLQGPTSIDPAVSGPGASNLAASRTKARIRSRLDRRQRSCRACKTHGFLPSLEMASWQGFPGAERLFDGLLSGYAHESNHVFFVLYVSLVVRFLSSTMRITRTRRPGCDSSAQGCVFSARG